MDYFKFERRIKRLAFAASEAARFRFTRDTIFLLHRAAAEAISDQMKAEQQQLLAEILAKINVQPTIELKEKLKRLHESMFPIATVAVHSDITDLLSAINNWLEYRATRNPEFIVGIAIDMVNMLDNAIGGDGGAYSTDNVLGSRAMREEYHRQTHFLAGQ